MAFPVRAPMRRVARTLAYLAIPLLVLTSVTGIALACVAPAEPTTLTTSLSGESKSGASITVLEGSKVKDQATLEGKNAAKATGKISYAVYKDSSCKELVTKAGEFEFKEGKVPASEEKTLEGGKTYYWQAHYGGDSLNADSTSACGAEVLSVKAATSVSTSLSGESKSGAEITVLEGVGVKDKATLSGTNSATATGKVKFKIYKDSECKELAAETEGVLSGGSAESAEQKLAGGIVYYWVASYEGDSLHQSSTGSCGSERLFVKAPTTLSTSLSGEEESGTTITVLEGAKVKDKATFSGTNSAKATGMVTYRVYADPECKEFVTGAGEVTVTAGSAPSSSELTLEGGKVYYWEAEYSGDTTHSVSKSTCGSEKVTVKAATSLSTLLFGVSPESEEPLEGVEVTIPEDFNAADSATLSGTNSSTATGDVEFKIFGDSECEELVSDAGEESVEEEEPFFSEEVRLGEGIYYWQAHYSGDPLHQASSSACDEILTVKAATSISTVLSGGEESGEEIVVVEGESVTDTATLNGPKASSASGTLEFNVYADAECKELVASAGNISMSEHKATSEPVILEPGLYNWGVRYAGDSVNSPSVSACGDEVVEVVALVGGGGGVDVKLHKTNAAGALLAGMSEVEGTSADLKFSAPRARGAARIDCSDNTFEGKVQNNGVGSAVIALTSWALENGGTNPGMCSTSAKFNGNVADAIVTVAPLKKGTLKLSAAGGFLSDFEVKIEFFVGANKELTCEYGTDVIPGGVPVNAPVQFAFNAALGATVNANGGQRLVVVPGSPVICGNRLTAKGGFVVVTKPGGQPVFVTH